MYVPTNKLTAQDGFIIIIIIATKVVKKNTTAN